MKITIILFASFMVSLANMASGYVFAAEKPPHIIFVMTDDQGWGQMGYRNHPVLKTPNLDAMAAGGLRFDRFYAGGPVCSPTRASVLTGRTHDRCGVLSHGYALRLQEKTLSQALKSAGYVTGHFGKWHLNGLAGPGAPILSEDKRHPGRFGFDQWVSVSNFYDRDPIMSRMGTFEEFQGDPSEIAVNEAVKFLEKHAQGEKPMFLLVWFGSPHSPFKASDEDKEAFRELDGKSANHYGELAAMDRSVGTLRQKLRDLDIAENTLLFFCSDNGGLPDIKPDSVGGLHGYKGSVYEGGIRVPGIVEWPAVIKPRVTDYPACVTDMFPTIVDLLDLPEDVLLKPIDGVSLKPLFSDEIGVRERPLGFRYSKQRAWVDNRYKLIVKDFSKPGYELYDLKSDPNESQNIADKNPEIVKKMAEELSVWNASVDASFDGKDYPEGKVTSAAPPQVQWANTPEYRPFLESWKDRWEYRAVIKKAFEQN